MFSHYGANGKLVPLSLPGGTGAKSAVSDCILLSSSQENSMAWTGSIVLRLHGSPRRCSIASESARLTVCSDVNLVTRAVFECDLSLSATENSPKASLPSTS